MSHSGTYTYNQIQTLHSNAHTLTLSRTIAFRIHTCIHTLCSQARQRGVSLHHTLGRTHIHHRYIMPYTLTRGKHTHYLQKTHTSEILSIYSYTGNTYSLPTQQTHQRYIMPYTPQTGSLRHRLATTYTTDTMHLLLHGDTANTFTRVFGKQTYSHTRERHQT